MVATNRYRWPLPVDPSGPPMAYPEPMPTYMLPSMAPPATAAPPTPMAQAPATPTDIAYPPTGFQEPKQIAAPEVSPEDDEFNRQMEEEQVEADWTRMTKRATAVLKVEADMQKARNAVAEAHKKATQRPSLEAPDEPLNRVFDKYVKGHAPMPTLEEYKASLRAPTGAEALSWTGEAPGFQDYILAGGQPEELGGIRKEEADRVTLEKYAPQFMSGVQGPPMTFEENRELVRRQREHREATMAPIKEKLADISERRKALRRRRKPPTAWDVMEHKERVAEITAPLAKQWQPKVIENIETSEQRPYTPGELIPAGWKLPGTIERPEPSALEKKTKRPEAYHKSLANAIDAINRGANPYNIYRKIARTYPAFSAELKRILLSEQARKETNVLLEMMLKR